MHSHVQWQLATRQLLTSSKAYFFCSSQEDAAQMTTHEQSHLLWVPCSRAGIGRPLSTILQKQKPWYPVASAVLQQQHAGMQAHLLHANIPLTLKLVYML